MTRVIRFVRCAASLPGAPPPSGAGPVAISTPTSRWRRRPRSAPAARVRPRQWTPQAALVTPQSGGSGTAQRQALDCCATRSARTDGSHPLHQLCERLLHAQARLGADLHEQAAVRARESHALRSGHLPLALVVQLVRNHELHAVGHRAIHRHLAHPHLRQVLERLTPRDVVHWPQGCTDGDSACETVRVVHA